MAANDICQRPDGDEIRNLPIVRHESSDRAGTGKDDHHGHHGDTPDKRHLEFLDDGRNLLEEGCVGRFFGSGAPSHVDAEQMAQDGLRDVDGDAAEEGREDEEPLEVLIHCGGNSQLLRHEQEKKRGEETDRRRADSAPRSGSAEWPRQSCPTLQRP